VVQDDAGSAFQEAYHRHYARGNPPFDPRRSAKAYVPLAKHLPPGDGRMLDLGCGDGRLLHFLVRRGYSKLVGVDGSPGQLESARTNIGKGVELVKADVLGYLEGEIACFDAIFMYDIIEHLPLDDALLLLRRARSHLSENGQVFVRTPNMGTLGASLSRYATVTHRIGLTERSIQELLDVAGYTGWEFIPTGPRGVYGWCKRRISRFAHRWAYWLSDRTPPRVLGKNLLVRAWKREIT